MRKKNQIPKYYAFYLIKLMKTICEQLINKKPLNLMKKLRKKTKKSMINKKLSILIKC